MTTGYGLLAKVIKEDIAPAIREGFQALSDVLDAKAAQIKFATSEDRLEWYGKGVEDAQNSTISGTQDVEVPLLAADRVRKLLDFEGDKSAYATYMKARGWDEGVATALNYAIRNDDGITLRLEKHNPYSQVRNGEPQNTQPSSMYRERTFDISDDEPLPSSSAPDDVSIVQQVTAILFNRWDDGSTTPEDFEGDAIALAHAGLLRESLPKPMTVGQLTAEHIGKRIRVDQGWYGDFDGKLVMVEHRTAGTNTGLTRLSAAEVAPRSYRSDAPCEVFDD